MNRKFCERAGSKATEPKNFPDLIQLELRLSKERVMTTRPSPRRILRDDIAMVVLLVAERKADGRQP